MLAGRIFEPGFARVDHRLRRQAARRTDARRPSFDIVDRFRRARSVKPKRALEVDPILQAPPQSFRRPVGSCAVAFFARRSATRTFADDRGLAGTNGPSLISPGGAHGVQPFAGLLPHAVGSSSLSRRTHLPFSSHRPTRLIFVGLARFAIGKW
jgi:hypothetical protein